MPHSGASVWRRQESIHFRLFKIRDEIPVVALERYASNPTAPDDSLRRALGYETCKCVYGGEPLISCDDC